ncbi:MAG: hypothetical protein WA268_18775 [Xanthobacteraceae bacterium]
MRITTLIFVAAAVALLAGGAQAQSPGQGTAGVTGGDLGGHRGRGKSQKVATPKPKVDEKGYKAALDQLPNKQYDAWHGVR